MSAKLAHSKRTSTLILLGIFLALLAFVYFFEIKGGASREQREKVSKQFFPVEREAVRHFELITQKDSLVCERQAGNWQIVAPVQTEGDSAMINSYLSSILEASIERKVLDTLDDPAAYGLLIPRGKIRIISQSNQVYDLLLGDENPTGDGMYVKIPTKPNLYTTGTSLWTYASKSLYDLRDKRTMHIDVNSVRRIEVTSRKKGTAKLEKVGNDWRIIEPVQIAANNNEVQSLLNRLANGRVKSFVSEHYQPTGKYGFEKPQVKIKLHLGESLAQTSFTVGDTARSDGGGFYAYEEHRQPVFTIENWAKDNLIKGAFDLQDKQLIRFDSEQIDRIVWRLSSQDCAALRVDSLHWLIVAPETLQVDDGAMKRFINALAELKADELESYTPKTFKEYGLDLPYLRLTVFQKDTQLGTILIGKATSDAYFVKNNQYPFVYRVKKYNAERIIKKPTDLKRIEPEK